MGKEEGKGGGGIFCILYFEFNTYLIVFYELSSDINYINLSTENLNRWPLPNPTKCN